MKKHPTLFLLIFFAAGFFVLQGQDEGVFPYEYKKIDLENGFKAYLIKAGSPGQISYTTVVRSGSRDEYEPGRSGYAHFFEHMMFRGTARYPNFDEVAGRIGAMSNASTGNDYTQYFLVASSDALEQIVDLESDRFMNLQYSESQFRTEAGAVLGEFSQGRGNPYYHLQEKIFDTAFDRHTYKHLTIGFEKDVRGMPEGYAYSLDFYRRYYRPENCVLLLAGDFDFKLAETLIRKYYSPWKAGYEAPQVIPEPPQTSLREATVRFPGRTLPILSVNYKGPAWSATDKMAVAAEVLGMVAFGSNSEIYKKLVVQERKVQSFSADFSPARDPGLLSLTTMATNPEDIPAVADEIDRTVAVFRNDLCDTALLENTKRAMKYGFLMDLETAQGVCFALQSIAAFTGTIESVEDYYRTLDSMAPEDIRAAARKYLVENGRTTITLLPTGDAE